MGSYATKQVDMEKLKKEVLAATDSVIKSQRDLPLWKTAVTMILLMSGKSEAIYNLPTIDSPKKFAGTDSSNDSSGLNQQISETSVKNSKGLLGLTKENISDILTYVNKSLAFPLNESEAEKKLGYSKNSEFCKKHQEFLPSEFVRFYKPFNDHAILWADLESGKNGIISQGNSLKVYGTSFVSHSQFVLNFISKMDVFPESIEDVPLTDKDKKTQTSLGKILDLWKEETIKYQASTDDLLKKLISFQQTLINTLQPSATRKLEELNKLDIANETKILKQEMDELQVSIDALQSKYDMYVGLAFSGAAGMVFPPLGILTWAVTGGVFGALAEETRKERNKKQSEYNKKLVLYNSLNSVSSCVHDATSKIADLGIAVTNAIVGLNALNTVWNIITSYVTSAKDSLLAIDHRSDLITFYFEVESAKDSWAEVPSLAEGLLDLFNQARKETQLTLAINEFSALLSTEAIESVKAVEEYRIKSVEKVVISPTPADMFCNSFDVRVWQDKFSELNKVLINPDSEYMPTLQKKAGNLRNYSREIFNDVIVQLAVLSNSDAVNAKSASDYELYDTFANKLKQDPNDKIAAEWVERIAANFKSKAEIFNTKVNKLAKNINGNTRILNDNTRQDLVATGFFAQLNDECKRFAKAIQNHTELMKNNFIEPILLLKENIRELDSNIDKKIDVENILKGFKTFLPSEKEISDILTNASKSQESAEIEAIKLTYSTALKSFDAFIQIISLCSDIVKLNKLIKELDDLRSKYNDSYAQLIHLLDEQKEIVNLLHLFSALRFFGESGDVVSKYITNVYYNLSENLINTDIRGYSQTVTDFINIVTAMELI